MPSIKHLSLTLAIGLCFSLIGISFVHAGCGSVGLKVYDVEEGDEPEEEDVLKAKKMAMDKAWAAYVKTLDAKYLKAYTKDKSKILSELAFYVKKQEERFQV